MYQSVIVASSHVEALESFHHVSIFIYIKLSLRVPVGSEWCVYVHRDKSIRLGLLGLVFECISWYPQATVLLLGVLCRCGKLLVRFLTIFFFSSRPRRRCGRFCEEPRLLGHSNKLSNMLRWIAVHKVGKHDERWGSLADRERLA